MSDDDNERTVTVEYKKNGITRAPDGSVVIFDGVTMVRIDPAALPAQTVGAVYVPPVTTERTTVGALRAWCEPKGDDDPPLGTICGVALDWQQAWWTLGQILSPLPDSTPVGLARVDVGASPAVAFVGEGWDVLIAGLDPRRKEARKAPRVDLAPPQARMTAPGGVA